ncbi:AfsR/SARP family transcriptional regulator, partial [Kineococcus glutinatus]|uniref:AfsR/SARP family transcriptional regulator n=1 Tax=Kineococcus glutinatus TaxID=1070872 RepID=UPI0031E66F86
MDTEQHDGTAPALRVLGPLEVVDASGAPHPLPPRPRRLLAALLTCAGSVVSADRLADVVWRGGGVPENPEAALHSLVSRLRSRLQAAAADGVELLHRSPGYLLTAAPGACDATRFDELLAGARRELTARPQRAAELLDAALALWRGAAYAEFADEDFARPEAARLEEERRCALEDRADTALLLGEHHAATAGLEALVRVEPLRERPHRQLVLAHYRAGRHADALAVARRFRERLAEELGIDPSAELVRLEEAVLRQDLAPVPGPGPAAGPGTAPGPAPAQHTAPHGAPPPDAPAPRGALLGRDEELAGVLPRVRPGAALTLTGPGGVGKTSLARQLAARLGGRFDDGVLFVELAAVVAPGDVAPAVTTALQLQPQQGTAPLQRLVAHLRPRSALVVLDNCEHVVAAAAELADALVAGCPAVAVLATSRCPLDVPAEEVWAVPPLPLPPVAATGVAEVRRSAAVQLFEQRARARCRTFCVDEANAADVAELCRRLDGLPLALELAAARMNALHPRDLVQRLSWRFRLLHGGSRTSDERHRTLQAVVDWSYDLLAERCRLLFEVVSVFAGGFPLADAERLVAAVPEVSGALGEDAGGSVADLLAALVDRSVLVVLPGGRGVRYGMLETLRAYGRERLAARGAAPAVQRAHAQLYAQVAGESAAHRYGPGHLDGVQRVAGCLDELRAAVAFALGSGDLTLAARLVGGTCAYVEHHVPAEVPQWAERVVAAAAARDAA